MFTFTAFVFTVSSDLHVTRQQAKLFPQLVWMDRLVHLGLAFTSSQATVFDSSSAVQQTCTGINWSPE